LEATGHVHREKIQAGRVERFQQQHGATDGLEFEFMSSESELFDTFPTTIVFGSFSFFSLLCIAGL
jgi:hypothetical protein